MDTHPPFALPIGVFEKSIDVPADPDRVAERLTVLEVMADLNGAFNVLREVYFLSQGNSDDVAHRMARVELACIRMRQWIGIRKMDDELSQLLKTETWDRPRQDEHGDAP